MKRPLLLLAALFLGLACTNTVSVFGDGSDDDGGWIGGAGGDPFPATTTGTSSAVTTTGTTTSTGVTTSSGVGGAGGSPTTSTTVTTSSAVTTATSSSVTSSSVTTTGSGGGAPCTHDYCFTGPALVDGCDPCVAQICAVDAFCCNQQWDQICVNQVDSVCNIDCFPSNQDPCGAQYPNKPVCSDDNGICALDHNATQMSCNALCNAGGGECLGAFNDVNDQQCVVNQNQPVSCFSQQLSSMVCVCSQGCGNGPACTGNQSCVNGQCQ